GLDFHPLQILVDSTRRKSLIRWQKRAAAWEHGFESRREGPKGVRSSLRRQSFSSDSKRGLLQPWVEPAVVSHPRRGNFGKRRVACGEPEKARGLLTGWSRTAGLSSGGWRPSPTTLSQPGRRGGSATTSWRSASRSSQYCFACRTTAETWLRLVAWSAVLCRSLHSGVLQKCAIIGGVAYESLTLHHKISFSNCMRVIGVYRLQCFKFAAGPPVRFR